MKILIVFSSVQSRYRLLTFLILFAAWIFPGTAAAVDRDPQRPVFNVHSDDRALAGQIDSILTTTYTQLVLRGGAVLRDTITVLVATRREQFDSTVGGHFPDWGAGCAIPSRRTIVILSPYLFPHEVNLVEVLRHELAHLYLHDLAGGARPPRWMDEGFAMLIGHQWRYGDDWLVARAMLSDRIVPLKRIETLNRFSVGEARLAYAQSYLAMNYFLQEYGWKSFLVLLQELRRSNNLDRAFMAAIGLKYSGFQTEFDSYLANKYNWAMLFSDTMLLWILLVGLLIILYLLKRWRTKKKLAEWEQAAVAEEMFDQRPGNRE